MNTNSFKKRVKTLEELNVDPLTYENAEASYPGDETMGRQGIWLWLRQKGFKLEDLIQRANDE